MNAQQVINCISQEKCSNEHIDVACICMGFETLKTLSIGEIKKHHDSYLNLNHSARGIHKKRGRFETSSSTFPTPNNSHSKLRGQEQSDEKILSFSSPALMLLCQYTKSKLNKPARIVFAEDLI